MPNLTCLGLEITNYFSISSIVQRSTHLESNSHFTNFFVITLFTSSYKIRQLCSGASPFYVSTHLEVNSFFLILFIYSYKAALFRGITILYKHTFGSKFILYLSLLQDWIAEFDFSRSLLQPYGSASPRVRGAGQSSQLCAAPHRQPSKQQC